MEDKNLSHLERQGEVETQMSCFIVHLILLCGSLAVILRQGQFCHPEKCLETFFGCRSWWLLLASTAQKIGMLLNIPTIYVTKNNLAQNVSSAMVRTL